MVVVFIIIINDVSLRDRSYTQGLDSRVELMIAGKSALRAAVRP